MTRIEFSPFHNRHIKFKLRGAEKRGVVLDMLDYSQKKRDTEYIFIPTNNMNEWKLADRDGNIQKKKELQQIINIEEIETPELLNY